MLREKDGTLAQRIRAFQLGLTTVHHHGSMIEHLLGIKTGTGEDFLNALSAGPHVEKWDKELEQVLGHPKGSIRKEVPLYWEDPDEAYLKSLQGNDALKLAAALNILLG
jgi:hypothetical protein